MADKLITQTENIYTQPIGQGNLLLIDPNKIVQNGKIYDRLVRHEDLVMYANLTARLIPRSKLVSGEGATDSEVTVELFDGELNFLKPQGKSSLDTDWTDAFTDPSFNKINYDEDENFSQTGGYSKSINTSTDFQGFGITSIDINISASFTPTVTIQFTDIRGKTLFEQGDVATPYTAFFHLPYPTFFLTLKGYYGQAVKYQLALVKFNASFDSSTGDYNVTCEFIGNHIALLRDITLQQAMVAPYMYPNVAEGDESPNKGRGRQVLEEIYDIYEQRGLIPPGFPRFTIWELIGKVETFAKDIQQQFAKVNLEILDDQASFQELLTRFYNEIFGGEGYISQYLDRSKEKVLTYTVASQNESVDSTTLTCSAYKINDNTTIDDNSTEESIKNAEEKLDTIITTFTKALSENNTFGGLVSSVGFGGGATYRAENYSGELDDYSTVIGGTKGFYIFEGPKNSFADKHKRLQQKFEDTFNIKQQELTEQLNQAFIDTLEFFPSIRNLMAVVIAGADTYLRLMDEVHTKAYGQRFSTQRISSVTGYQKGEFQDTRSGEQICYPWPNYYTVEQEGDSKELVLTYPGASTVLSETGAFDMNLWPEIEFVEEYIKTVNFRTNELNADFQNPGLVIDFIPLSIRDYPYNNPPYAPVNPKNSVIWELVDRFIDFNLYSGIRNYNGANGNLQADIIKTSAQNESENISGALKASDSLRRELQENSKTWPQLSKYLSGATGAEWQGYLIGAITTQTINGRPITGNNIPNTNNGLYPASAINDFVVKGGVTSGFTALISEQKVLTGIDDRFPFVAENQTWLQENMANGTSITPAKLFSVEKLVVNGDTKVYGTNQKTLFYSNWNFFDGNLEEATQIDRDLIQNEYETAGNWENYYEGRKQDIKLQNITEGIINYQENPPTTGPIGTTSMMNTPWFANAILNAARLDRLDQNDPYIQAAFLFVNSLPLSSTLEKTIMEFDSVHNYGAYVGPLIKQLASHHTLPYSLILKLGSLWWRYKTEINDNIDPIKDIITNLGGGTVYNDFGGVAGSSFQVYYYPDQTNGEAFPINSTTNATLGIWPELISATHYIVTGKDVLNQANYPTEDIQDNFISGFTVNVKPLNDLNFTFQGRDCKFVSVSTNSANVGSVGIDDGYQYYTIYYPSAGDLVGSDIDFNKNTFIDNSNPQGIYDGSARFLWGVSNFGYFDNTLIEQGSGITNVPQAGNMWKTIDTSRDQQDAWNVYNGQTPTDVKKSPLTLLSIFPREVLDTFETEFINFSQKENPDTKNVEGEFSTFKQVFQKMMVVKEDSPMEINEDTASAMKQYKNVLSVIRSFMFQSVMYKNGSSNDLDIVTNSFGGPMSNHQFLLWVIWNKTSNSTFKSLLGGENSVLSVYEFPPYSPPSGPPSPIITNIIESEIANDTNAFAIIDNFFSEINVAPSPVNIAGFASVIKTYYTYSLSIGNTTGAPLDAFANFYFETYYRLPGMGPVANAETYLFNQYFYLQTDVAGVDPAKDLTDEVKIDERPEIKADNLKLEMYQAFKTMNDKWISGTQLGGEGIRDGAPYYNTLFERFMFLDRANRDIGKSAVIDIFIFQGIDTPFTPEPGQSVKQSIATFVSDVCSKNYFNFMPLPSYVNFYAQTNAGDYQAQGNGMFGTHKVVDTTKSSPVYLCQYVGEQSKNLNVKTPNNGYTNDSFDIGDTVPNPLLSSEPSDMEKPFSNKVMAFAVDFGIPNQNIFENIQLDQSEFQDTSESFEIVEQLGQQANGRSISVNSVNLFNLYKSRNYKVTVTCMGNAMIQPTTYFQLRYVPMFAGPYMVTSVKHSIRPNTMQTTFVGTRIPIPNVPKITNLIMKIDDSLLKKLESETEKAEGPPPKGINDFFFTPVEVAAIEELSVPNSDPVIEPLITPVDTILAEVYQNQTGNVEKGINYVPKPEHKGKDINILNPITGVITSKVAFCTTANGPTCGNGFGNHLIIEKTLVEEGSSSFTPGTLQKIKVVLSCLKQESFTELDEGDVIEQGTIVGLMGNTGSSYGTNLHYELIRYIVQEDYTVKEQWVNLNDDGSQNT